MKPSAITLVLVMLIYLPGCSQHNFTDMLSSGEVMRLKVPSSASTGTYAALEDHYLFWSDTRAGSNRSCGLETCNHNLFALDLRTGEEITIANTEFSDVNPIADDGYVVWEERHPPLCRNYSDPACIRFFRIWRAPLANFSDKEVIYVSNDSLLLNWKDYYDGLLVLEKYSPFNYNHVELVSLPSGDVTDLPIREPKPDPTHNAKTEAAITQYGTIMLTKMSVWGGENVRDAVEYDIESGDFIDSDPPFSLSQWHILSRKRSEDGRMTFIIREGENYHVWAYNLTSGDYELLYETKNYIIDPIVSGNILLYINREDAPQCDIYAYNLDTGEERRITHLNQDLTNIYYDKPYLVFNNWKLVIMFMDWEWT